MSGMEDIIGQSTTRMRKSSKRYCASGENCTQYIRLGEPAPLSRYNKMEICEACRRYGAQNAEHDTSSLALAPPQNDKQAQQKSIRIHKAQRFKRDLVLQLFTRRGPFWKEIEKLRRTNNISAVVQLPLPTSNIHCPEGVSQQNVLWRGELCSLLFEIVPERYRLSLDEWVIFLSAYVLYDPPETQLLEFAAYSDPQPIHTAFEGKRSDRQARDARIFGSPSISNVADPEEAAEIERWFYETVIERIEQQFLEPLGLNIWDMFDEVEDDELFDEYMHRIDCTSTRPYIYADEQTTEDDVREAFRALRVLFPEPNVEVRKPPRDQLLAVQCAILADNHRWTQKQIAQHFGWKSKDRVKDHVKLGRKMLGTYTT